MGLKEWKEAHLLEEASRQVRRHCPHRFVGDIHLCTHISLTHCMRKVPTRFRFARLRRSIPSWVRLVYQRDLVRLISPRLKALCSHLSTPFLDWPGRALHPAFSPLIIIQSHDEHSRRRKPWNRAFSTSSLKGYEPVIEKRARQLVEHLSEHKDEVVDLAQWISFFT